MGKEIILSSWDDFIQLTKEFGDEESEPLYRGQGNSMWHLENTLERIGRTDEPLESYYRSILIALSAIKCCHTIPWDIPKELNDKYTNPQTLFTGFYELPATEYMLYLRHHGFPSPLLDWSKSPYVASFFAYVNAQPEDEYCSIFKFIEFGKTGKGGASPVDAPKILSIGPCVATDKRHYMQQSQYTYCMKKTNKGLIFGSHEKALDLPLRDGDELIKYKLPISERSSVLKSLRDMNITAYTLFGHEDALISSIAFDEYIIDDRRW